MGREPRSTVCSQEQEVLSSASRASIQDVCRRWYLVRTKPSAEEIAQVNLERQGYHVYFPRLLQRKLLRGRWRDNISALFPRYLFLQLDGIRQSLAPVKSTLGITDVVRFGCDYAVVPERIIVELLQRADTETGLHYLKESPFSRGDTVRVMNGVLSGIDGIFDRELAEHRIVVLFKLLGRYAEVVIPAKFVFRA